MDMIKKFFEKKKSDGKFRQAGPGKKLTAQSSSSSEGPRVQHARGPAPRVDPSAGARRAGAAALDRFTTNKQSTEVDWAAQAIKARLRRELEAEKRLQDLSLQDQQKAEAAAAPTDTTADQHVMFSCPSFGLDIGTYDTIKSEIKQVLYAQVDEDKGAAACLIIRTCNKGDQKITVCVETLCKYIDNIVVNREDDKFRKIRLSNKAYQERVHSMEGAALFLEAGGFSQQQLPFIEDTENFWVFPSSGDVERLSDLSASLSCAKALRPSLERSPALLLPRQAAVRPHLPQEFFAISKEEIQKEKQLRSEAVEQSQLLLTKAARERLHLKDMRKYRFSLTRVRFPDGLTLQGTFRITEKLSDVTSFVRDYLVNDWRPFFLCPSGAKKFTAEDEDRSLVELSLVPTVVLNFMWDSDVSDPGLDDSVMLGPQAYDLISQDQLLEDLQRS